MANQHIYRFEEVSSGNGPMSMTSDAKLPLWNVMFHQHNGLVDDMEDEFNEMMGGYITDDHFFGCKDAISLKKLTRKSAYKTLSDAGFKVRVYLATKSHVFSDGQVVFKKEDATLIEEFDPLEFQNASIIPD